MFGRTLRWFSVYVLVLGIGLLLAPGVLCRLLELPIPPVFWTRVMGLLLVALAYYYYAAGRDADASFARASIPARMIFVVGVVILVLTGGAPGKALLVASVDALGAWWTASALRRSL